MSTPQTEDRLLVLTRWLLTGLLGISILVGAICLLALPVMAVRWEALGDQLEQGGIHRSAMPTLAVMLVLVAVGAVVAFLFLRQLRRIVTSVSEGDPFAPINADRLKTMAWLALAFQVVLVPMAGLMIWFDALPHKPNVHHGSDGISPGALILALLLFVLARVFRVGSEMRPELEGTV